MQRKKKNEKEFTIVVDTRENHPYKFQAFNNPIVRKALKTGDYSILGLEDKVSVERKSKDDIYGSLGRSRKRFERMVTRLSKFDYGAIVIEASTKDILIPPERSMMNPKSVILSLISWSIRYKVFVYFASGRRHAEILTYRILEKYWTNEKHTLNSL
jgi:ERCC4-type nuclease